MLYIRVCHATICVAVLSELYILVCLCLSVSAFRPRLFVSGGQGQAMMSADRWHSDGMKAYSYPGERLYLFFSVPWIAEDGQ